MRTLVEGARGCGHRKPGGLYLVSDAPGMGCDLLPVVLDVCPCCGAGIKPARGWTWVDPSKLLPHHADNGEGFHSGCPLNHPGTLGERAGLLWIGEAFYKTPSEWINEGHRLGFSRRIKSVPRGFEIGTTWVLAAHRKAITTIEEDGPKHQAAIFHIWRPARIEYVVRGDETAEALDDLRKRSIEPVRVVKDQMSMEVED